MPEPLLLAVDGNSLVHRSFHALAGTSSFGDWAVRGFLGQLVAAVDRIRPTAVVVGFDDPGASVRRTRWPQYKAHRSEKPTELVDQLVLAAETLESLGIAVVTPPGLEADDVLASAAAYSRGAGGGTVVVTSDRDSFALIDEHTSVLRIINGGVDASPLLTPERLVDLVGVHPWQYRDYAALRGDPSDNLPGVSGIGPKTAARLLQAFGTAAAAFADLVSVEQTLGGSIARRLLAPGARQAWELNRQVMAHHHDVELGTRADESGGLGALPLTAATVAGVFRSLNLTWSIKQAVRVFADAEWDEPTPPPRPRRIPPTRVPISNQLALFD